MYRKVVTAVWSDDRQSYTAGCIVHGVNGSVTVRFYRYQVGKGVVGRCKPTDEMSQWLKQYGQELKAYVNRRDKLEASRLNGRNVVIGSKVVNVNVDKSARPAPGG